MTETEWNEMQERTKLLNEEKALEEEKNGKKLARTLTDMVNTCGANNHAMECLIEYLLREHRTLQQAFFGNFIMKFIETVANLKEGNGIDLRNAEMKKMCDLIYDTLSKNNMAYTDCDGKKTICGMPFV